MHKYKGTCLVFGGKKQIDEETWEMYTDQEITIMLDNALKGVGFICKEVKVICKYNDLQLQYLVECLVEYNDEIIFDGHSQDFYLKGIKTFDFQDVNNCLCEFTVNEKVDF